MFLSSFLCRFYWIGQSQLFLYEDKKKTIASWSKSSRGYRMTKTSGCYFWRYETFVIFVVVVYRKEREVILFQFGCVCVVCRSTFPCFVLQIGLSEDWFPGDSLSLSLPQLLRLLTTIRSCGSQLVVCVLLPLPLWERSVANVAIATGRRGLFAIPTCRVGFTLSFPRSLLPVDCTEALVPTLLGISHDSFLLFSLPLIVFFFLSYLTSILCEPFWLEGKRFPFF